MFPTQGLKPHLLHCRETLYHGATWEARFSLWLSKLGFHGLPHLWSPTHQRHPERKTVIAGADQVGTRSLESSPGPEHRGLWVPGGNEQVLLLTITPELTYLGCPRHTQNRSAPHPKCPGKEQKAEKLREPLGYSTHHDNTPRWCLSKQANKKGSFFLC